MQTRDPATTVDAYLERCALKTGKLFEAACRLGGGSADYGLALGIAFQIADDVLDCSGVTIETGKIAAPTSATGRRRCRCSSQRSRTTSCAPRSRAGRWTARL